MKQGKFREIWSSHGGEGVDVPVLCFNFVWTCRKIPKFQRNGVAILKTNIDKLNYMYSLRSYIFMKNVTILIKHRERPWALKSYTFALMFRSRVLKFVHQPYIWRLGDSFTKILSPSVSKNSWNQFLPLHTGIQLWQLKVRRRVLKFSSKSYPYIIDELE
jgi:hypothetical protein